MTTRIGPSRERSTVAVVAVSAAAVGTGSSMGFMYGFVAPDLRADLGIGRAEVGLLVSVYFGATGVVSIWGGRLSDRIGARRAVRADMVVVAAMAAGTAILRGYAVLLLLGAIAGAGYSLANAGTNHAVGSTVPAHRRGIALNVKTTGVPVLVAVGAFAAPPLADAAGWRWAYLAIAAAAVLAAIAVSMVLPDAVSRSATSRGGAVAAGLWRYPVGCCLLLIGSQPVFSWSVSFLVDEHAVSKGAAGMIVAVSSLIGAAAMITTGRLSDHLGVATRRPLVAGLTALVCAATATLALGAQLPPGWLVVVLGAAVAAQLSAIGTMHASLVDIAPLAIGRASGITMTGYYLGALIAPVLFGALADGPGYRAAWGVCAVSCAAGAVVFASATRIAMPATTPTTADHAAVNTTG